MASVPSFLAKYIKISTAKALVPFPQKQKEPSSVAPEVPPGCQEAVFSLL